jgi:hypothetical protein
MGPSQRLRRLVCLTVLAGGATLLSACGASSPAATPPPASQDTTASTGPTPTSNTTPLSVAGTTLTASTNGGDGFQTNFTLWEPTSGSQSNAVAAIAACDIDPSRAVSVQMQLHTEATSRLSEAVVLTFQLPAANPGVGAFIMDYSSGDQCVQGANLATVKFSISPQQPNTFTMWLIYDNAITPDQPLGINAQGTLGHWLTQVALVTIQGQQVDNESLSGTRVITCGGDDSSTSYIVAAGALPTSISDGIGDSESCTFQVPPAP